MWLTVKAKHLCLRDRAAMKPAKHSYSRWIKKKSVHDNVVQSIFTDFTFAGNKRNTKAFERWPSSSSGPPLVSINEKKKSVNKRAIRELIVVGSPASSSVKKDIKFSEPMLPLSVCISSGLKLDELRKLYSVSLFVLFGVRGEPSAISSGCSLTLHINLSLFNYRIQGWCPSK